MEEKQKKVISKKETKKVVKTTSISSEEMKDKTLQELKKAADKSFKKKYSNKRKVVGLTLGAIGLAAIGTVTPIVVLSTNKEISVLVQSVNVSADKYKVKVKKGTKIKDIKIVELEGYEFLGYFKDEACTKAYQPTDTLENDSTIYASYSQKRYNVNITGDTENYNVSANATLNYGESYTLTISPKEGFNVSFLTVKVDGEEVTLIDGNYTIPNVTEDTTIEIIANNETAFIAIGNSTKQVAFMPNTIIKEVIESLETLEYETSGTVYLDEECTQEADLNAPMTASTILYTKAATLDKLSFSRLVNGWSVKPLNTSIQGDVVIPASYTDGVNTGNVINVGGSGYYGFKDCVGITSVTIPNTVTDTTMYTFTGCTNLKNVILSNAMDIQKGLFSGCTSLSKITIPNGIKSISIEAFYGCSGLTEITIPNTVTSIREYAFKNCSGLTSVNIPNGVKSIGSSAFSYCRGLTSITIPNSVTTIEGEAFAVCSGLTSITVEAGNRNYHSSGNCLIETASKKLIQGCNTSIIPTDGSVTTIGKSVFEGCSGLTSITIPNTVISIEMWAFVGCNRLTTVIIDSATIANSLTSATTNGYVINNATTVYIKTSLSTANSTYLTNNFTKQATSDKDGYDMWVKNS